MYWLTILNNNLRLTLGAGGSVKTEQEILATANVVAGQWQHVVATFDGTTARIYHNGSKVADEAVTLTLAYGDESLFIGHIPNRSFDFDGLIDELRIYGGAATDAEVTDLFANYDAHEGGTGSGGNGAGGSSAGGNGSGGDGSGGNANGGDGSAESSSDDGCSCSVPGSRSTGSAGGLLWLLAAGLIRRRR